MKGFFSHRALTTVILALAVFFVNVSFAISFDSAQQTVYYSASNKLKKAATKDLSILALIPETGPAASLGDYLKNGFSMYLENHRNANVNIRYVDSQGNPRVALSGVEQAILIDRPDVVISAMSLICAASIPITEKENIFNVAILTTSEDILKGNVRVQRISPTTSDHLKPLTKYTIDNFDRLSLLYSNEEYGLSNANYFSGRFQSGDRKVVFKDGYSLGERETRILAQKAISVKPDVVYTTGFGPAYISIIKSLLESGYSGARISDSALDNPVVRRALGNAATGVIFTGTQVELSSPSSTKASLFRKIYVDKFGGEPMYIAALAYDTLSILDYFQTRGKLISHDSFQQLAKWEGVAFDIDFLPGGECSVPFELMVTQGDGSVRLFDKHLTSK